MDIEEREQEIARSTTDLYKYFLEVLEEIKIDHESGIDRLRKALVFTQNRVKKKHDLELIIEPIALQARFFDEKYYNILRKRILDKGNETIRKNKALINK